jgi:Do/DeqQ family serine protease
VPLRKLIVPLSLLLAVVAGGATNAGSLSAAVGNFLQKDRQPQQSPASEQAEQRVPENQTEIQLSFAPVVKKVVGSVVNVYGSQSRRKFRSPFAGDPFFERFFGVPQSRGRSSLGSGVIVAANGIVLTNNHVVENMDSVKVAMADGREFDCEIVLKDDKSDLAVLKIDADETFTPIEIGDSDAVEVGDLVLAIGNPFGVGQTVTSGIVSAVSRSLAGVNDYGFFIQTDAAINPGNSGGALVDMHGRLIGINTMIYSRSGGSIGIGYAVPSNMTRVILNSAESGDKVKRPWIGATFRNVTAEIADSLGMDRPAGALVVDVDDNSPAEKAGLKPGDIVLSINGLSVDHPDVLGYRLDTIGIGKNAEFELLSRGKRKKAQIQLLEPPETVPRDVREMSHDSPLFGASFANLSPALAEEIGMSGSLQGVVAIEVEPDSLAAFNGLHKGDIVAEVNGVEVESTRQLQQLMDEPMRAFQLVVNRDGQSYVFERNGRYFRQYRRG